LAVSTKGREEFMAKKRLNKKVALIGSLVLAVTAVIVILAILHFSRDPEKSIRDGDAAVKAAKEATDEQVRAEEYKRAESSYGQAAGLAKTDSLRIKALFRLVDVHLAMNKWSYVLGDWDGIIKIDEGNTKARYGLLKYAYIRADSTTAVQAWRDVASQASDFLELAEDEASLLMQDTAELESFRIGKEDRGGRPLGAYLYLIRGRAILEMTEMGAFTNPDESLVRAINDLKKAQELEPDNIDSYWYLAQTAIEEGNLLASKGQFGEKERSLQRAADHLNDAIGHAGTDARSHINVLRIRPLLAQIETVEQAKSLEPEYLSLVQRFPSSPDAHMELARFYQQLGPSYLDKAIEAGEKAIELDKENVAYAIAAASLHYRKFSIYGEEAHLHRAIEVARKGLEMPEAQDKPGPREWANRMIRIRLYAFLANCHIEQMLQASEKATELQKQECLGNAEAAVHEIEQLFPSGDNAYVVQWQGMLELAKGNEHVAVRKLYATYEQLKAASRRGHLERVDPLLAYRLAKIFENTTELGAVNEFFAVSLRVSDRNAADKIDERKPEALLDYSDVLLRLRNYNRVLELVDIFEQRYWANDRSHALRIKALLGANRLDEAEEQLAKQRPDDPNTIRLNLALTQAKTRHVQRVITQIRADKAVEAIAKGSQTNNEEKVESEESIESRMAELRVYRDALADQTEKLLQARPSFVSEGLIAAVCNHYVAEKNISKAKDLVSQFLENSPDSIRIRLYQKVLSEPEPGNIPQQRRREIEEEVTLNISEPTERTVHLGLLYYRYNEPTRAAAEFKKALPIEDPESEKPEEITDLQRLAAGYLFNIALDAEDWDLAKQVANFAARANLDDCEGQFFFARLTASKKEYKEALARLEECLRQKPVYSAAYVLRSNINSALGDERAAIEDARKAASLNPMHGAIARTLAILLYERNRKLGDRVSADQAIETRAALDKAVALNPSDFELLSFYAEYISETEPVRAIAIRQNLQRVAPSIRNAIFMGRLATRMALEEMNAARKEALIAMARVSFEQARAMEPESRAAIEAYVEFLRLIGRHGEAEKILAQSKDKRLQWQYYFRAGQFDKARTVCEQLYRNNPDDSNSVRGLFLIAEKTADKEAAKTYSEELLRLDESVENQLMQIQTYLKLGLVKEAEHKLQSFKEKNDNEPRALLLEAWLAMRQGHLERALDLTNRTLAANQENATAWRLKGQIDLLIADYAQAIIDLGRCKMYSDDPAVGTLLAKAYVKERRYEEAIIELDNAINHPHAPLGARVLLESICLKRDRKGRLRRLYEETLDKFPDSVFWHNRAGSFAISEREFARAEQFYERAWQKADRNPGDAESGKTAFDALDGYLRALTLGNKFNKVIEEGRKYTDSSFAPIAYLRMAEAKLKLGDRTAAREHFEKAVDRAGTNDILLSRSLREAYALLGAQESLRNWDKRLRANPELLAANLAMFYLTKMNADYNKAVGHIDKCLQIVGPGSSKKNDYTLKKAEVLQLAYLKTSDNNYLRKTMTVYESLLAEMPNNTGVLNNLAYMLAVNNERLPEALEHAERAYKLRPDVPSILDTYSYVLYKNDKPREAEEFLLAAIQQYEQDMAYVPAEVYEHLGMIKEKLGAKGEALAAYQQALDALDAGASQFSEAARERIMQAIERLSP
jgi:tetratricopeptide (TPR) repeat protein